MLPLSCYACPPKVVSDSPPTGLVGAPVSFFVRRPDATDASESLGRFPTDGLTAMFQWDRCNHPKGGEESLIVVPRAVPSELAERAEPTPTLKGKPADKSKVAGGDEPVGSDGLEARWRTIRSEVESNRCLVIGAGDNFSLKTQRLFESEADAEMGRGAVVQGGEATRTADSRLREQGGKEAGEGVVEEGSGAVLCLQPDGTERECAMIGQSSQFTVCVDFRIQLDLNSLENGVDEGATGSSATASGDMNPRQKHVRIISCGERAEVSATVVRSSTPLAATGKDAGLAEAGDTVGDTGRGDTLGSHGTSTAPLRAEHREPKSVLSGRTSVSQDAETSDVVGDAPAGPLSTWILDSITVRVGSYIGVAPCANPRENQPCEAVTAESSPAHGIEPERKGSAGCVLNSWHGLALVVNREDEAPPALWVDGETFPLSPQRSAGVGTGRDELEAASHGVVVLGGLGGEWATLAVKNLVVYNKALDSQNLGTITRVYGAWREEQATATAMEVLEDERWLEEAKKAAEDGREPGERLIWERAIFVRVLVRARAPLSVLFAVGSTT